MTVKFDNCRGVYATDKGLLVNIPEIDTEPVWVPQNHIDADSEVYRKDDEGTLIVSDWIAEKKGWA